MSKYIDAERLKTFVQARRDMHYNHYVKTGVGCIAEYKYDEDVELLDLIVSLQQEPTPDTDVLHTELVNLLKTYRIGEETARTMADRIADTYGAQKYMDGLCDGLDEEDTKQEQEKFREKLIEWAKENMDSLGRLSYGEFIDKLNSM